MSLKRRSVLTIQALLTIVFFSAAVFTFFGNPGGSEPLAVQSLTLGEAPQAVRLTVNDTGIAAVTMRQLRGADLNLETMNAETISLSRDGQAVPFYVQGEGNEATLYFYAQAITRSLEMPAVYWLAPGRGKTMSQRDRSPGGPGISQGTMWRHWEENSSYHAYATGDDNWFGANVYAPDSLEMALTGIQPTGGPGILTVRVWSSTQSPANPDHHMRVQLNGMELADYYWDGITQATIDIPFRAGALRRQGNGMLLDVPGDTGAAGESIYLDWVRLEYQGELTLNRGQLAFRSSAANFQIPGAGESALAFDISDPNEPILMLNTDHENGVLRFAGNGARSTYVALNPRDAIRPLISAAPQWPEPLKSAEHGADYIAIVAGAGGFPEALQPLLDHRRSQGLRVVAVPLQQIYDEFGFGRQSPEAIRRFLQYAHDEWREPRPQYVLLAGDASYDVNDYTGARNQNLLPAPLVRTQSSGYVASDSWYAMFEGSAAPSMAVGRFPAQNSRNLRVMVDKVIAYERAAPSPYRARALMVADDEPRFDTSSDRLARELNLVGFIAQKLYMTQNEDIHDSIISALNHGVGIVNYAGHGGIDAWGDEAVLRSEDAITLRNGNRLSIFTTFSCLNGVFNHPEIDGLAETLLWTRGGGIVAAVAPSGRTYSAQQTPLSAEFYRQLLSGESPTIGDALLRAKQLAAQGSELSSMTHAFNLLGDPALRFQLPQPTQ